VLKPGLLSVVVMYLTTVSLMSLVLPAPALEAVELLLGLAAAWLLLRGGLLAEVVGWRVAPLLLLPPLSQPNRVRLRMAANSRVGKHLSGVHFISLFRLGRTFSTPCAFLLFRVR